MTARKKKRGVIPAVLNIEPLERTSLAEQVSKRILELVRTGNLRPGDRLPPERDLAVMMGVSPPSVREALRGLQILGVIKSGAGGAQVSSLEAGELLGPFEFLISLNDRNVDTLHQARVLIEGGIGRMAANLIDDDAIRRLREIVTIQEKLTSDPVGFRVSDLEFHRLITNSCDNPFLDRIANSLYVLGIEYRRVASETPGVIEQSVVDHRRIVEGLAARDPERSGASMEEHMRNVGRSTKEAMKKLRGPGLAGETQCLTPGKGSF